MQEIYAVVFLEWLCYIRHLFTFYHCFDHLSSLLSQPLRAQHCQLLDRVYDAIRRELSSTHTMKVYADSDQAFHSFPQRALPPP